MNANILYSSNLNNNTRSPFIPSHNPALFNAFIEKLFDSLLDIDTSIDASTTRRNKNNSLYLLENILLPAQYIPILENIIPPTWNSLFLYYLYALDKNRQFVLVCNNMLRLNASANPDSFFLLWNDVIRENRGDYVRYLRTMFELLTDIDTIRHIKELFTFVMSRDEFQTLQSREKDILNEFALLSNFFQEPINDRYVPVFFEIFILYYLLAHILNQLFPTAAEIQLIPSQYQTIIQQLNIVSMGAKFAACGRLMKKVAASAIRYPKYSASAVDGSTHIQSFMNQMSCISQFIFTNPACLFNYATNLDGSGSIDPNQIFSLFKHFTYTLTYHTTTKVANVALIANILPIFNKYLADQLLISPMFVPLFALQKKDNADITGEAAAIVLTPSPVETKHTISLRMPTTKTEEEIIPANGTPAAIVAGYPIFYEDAAIAGTIPLPTNIFVYQRENEILAAIDKMPALTLEVRLLENGDYQLSKNGTIVAIVKKEKRNVGAAAANAATQGQVIDEEITMMWNFADAEWNYSDLISVCFIFYSLLSMEKD